MDERIFLNKNTYKSTECNSISVLHLLFVLHLIRAEYTWAEDGEISSREIKIFCGVRNTVVVVSAKSEFF